MTKAALRTIYHSFFCDDVLGEADGFFEIIKVPTGWIRKGAHTATTVESQLKYITGWSCNDANWRDEYMGSLLRYAGLEVKSLPAKHEKEAASLMAQAQGLLSCPFYEDAETMSCRLYCDEGTSDKVYELALSQDDGWNVTARFGRRNGTLKEQRKAVGLSYEDAKTIYNQTKKQKLKKGYYE